MLHPRRIHHAQSWSFGYVGGVHSDDLYLAVSHLSTVLPALELRVEGQRNATTAQAKQASRPAVDNTKGANGTTTVAVPDANTLSGFRAGHQWNQPYMNDPTFLTMWEDVLATTDSAD